MRLEGWKLPALALVSFGLGAGLVYAKGAAKEYSMVTPSEQKFNLADPNQPHGPQVAILNGDPKTGPVALLLKLEKGKAPMHWHSSDYYAITLKGQTKHWLPGKEADAKTNAENTFWFQPGGSEKTAHGDECVTDTGCVSFIYLTGKFDFMLAAPPKGAGSGAAPKGTGSAAPKK